MKKYANFLLEKQDFVKNLSKENAIRLFKLTSMYETVEKGIEIPEENLFYRIVKEGVADENGDWFENEYSDYNVVDPDSITRISPYSGTNLYNLTLSNLPSWTKLPKRDNSLIGGDINAVNMRGYVYENQLMVVVPYDTEIGVCASEDIWYSFRKNIIGNIDEFFSDLRRMMSHYEIEYDDENWKNFIINLEELDKIRKDDEHLKNERRDMIPHPMIKDEKLKKDWENHKISTFDLLDIVFDPDKNDIKTIDFDGSFKLEQNREMWCDSKSLLIRRSVWEDFIESVKEYYNL